MHSNCVTTFEINFGILSTVVLHYIHNGVKLDRGSNYEVQGMQEEEEGRKIEPKESKIKP
jgi:hypothetical protein